MYQRAALIPTASLIIIIFITNSLVLNDFVLQNILSEKESQLNAESILLSEIEDISTDGGAQNIKNGIPQKKRRNGILKLCKKGVFVLSDGSASDDLMRRIQRRYGEYCTIIPSIAKGSLISVVVQNSSADLSYNEIRNAFPTLSTLSYVKRFRIARRNLAFLVAIYCGANFIFEIDSTMSLIEARFDRTITQLQSPDTKIQMVTSTDSIFINPHILFRPIRSDSGTAERHTWPRGFPLFLAGRSQTYSKVQSTLGASRAVLFTSLIDTFPDIDFSMPSMNKKISFAKRSAVTGLQHGTVAPFGSTAVIWTKAAYPFLYLPITVNERYVDIVRSYITQRLFMHFNYTVSFISPIVFRRQQPVYNIFQTHRQDVLFSSCIVNITKLLFEQWQIETFTNFEKIFLSLYESLYDEQHISKSDLLSSEAWIHDICAIGKELCPNRHVSLYENTRLRSPDLDSTFERSFDHETHEQANVAICVSGQLRSLNLSVEDENHPKSWRGMRSSMPPPNITVAESIQNVLYPQLGHPDVFVVVSTRETQYEPKVGDRSACEPLRPRNGHFSCLIKKEINVNISRESQIWNEFLLAKESSNGTLYIQGLLQQLKGMFECYQEIERYSTKTMKQYDWIVRLRPDSYFYKFPSLAELASEDTSGNAVWYASRKHCCCGNEDSFGIGPWNVMRAYLERFVHLQQVPPALGRRWNAEKYLELYLKGKGMVLKESPNMHICKVKPVSRRERSSP